MAKVLVTYMDCPKRIARAIRAEFGTSPSRAIIMELRTSYLRPMAHSEPCKPHDGYYPGDEAAKLAKASMVFLVRLQDERARSAAKALNSNYLKQPALVNLKWNKAMEKAA